MERKQYVTGTWALALLLHPPLFYLLSIFIDGDSNVEILLLAALMGLFFSLPGYIFCLIFSKAVLTLPCHPQWRLAAWILCCLIGIVAGFALLVALFFGASALQEVLLLSLPGCIAAIVSILIRYKAFFELLNNIENDEYDFV